MGNICEETKNIGSVDVPGPRLSRIIERGSSAPPTKPLGLVGYRGDIVNDKR